MSAPQTTKDPSKSSSRLLLAGAALALLGLAFWLFSGRDKVPEPKAEADVAEAPAEPVPPPETKRAAPAPTPARAPEPPATTAAETAPDQDPPPSHPITEAHLRIRLENGLIQEANDAIDLRNAPKLRELAVRYRAEGFQDVDKHADGYEIIADCIEHPGEASRAAAQRFWDDNGGSNLRRYVRRHCLE